MGSLIEDGKVSSDTRPLLELDIFLVLAEKSLPGEAHVLLFALLVVPLVGFILLDAIQNILYGRLVFV